MGITTVCLLVFCAHLVSSADEYIVQSHLQFGDFKQDTYSYELQADTLAFQANLTLLNATSLHRALEYHVKVRIEKGIRNALVMKTHLTLDKLAGLAASARGKGLDMTSCYTTLVAEARTVFQDQMSIMKPCVIDVIPEYLQLTSDLVELEAEAKALLNEIPVTTKGCASQTAKEVRVCLAYELSQLQKKQELLQYVYNKLHRKYEVVLELVAPAVDCIQSSGNEMISNLFGVLNKALDCYSTLETEREEEEKNKVEEQNEVEQQKEGEKQNEEEKQNEVEDE